MKITVGFLLSKKKKKEFKHSYKVSVGNICMGLIVYRLFISNVWY